jgi:ketosteroid isomerase-like protein
MSLTDEVVRCYDALNHGDPYAFLELYAPDIELFVASWAGPDGGLYRGAEVVNRWYAHYFAQWTDQHWKVVETLEQGPNVAFVVHWSAKGKRSDVAVTARFFVVMTFLEGKLSTIAQLGSFDDALMDS